MSWSDEEIYLVAQRGYEFATQGRYELATVLFEGLLAVAPAYAYARRALAAVQIQAGAAASAIRTLDGLSAAERDGRSRQLRLEALLALGRFKEAATELAAARPYLDARAARRIGLGIEHGPKQLSGPQPDK